MARARARRGWPAALLVGCALAVTSCSSGGDKVSEGCGATHPPHAQVYRVRALPNAPVTPARVAATVDALCRRLGSTGTRTFSVHRTGADRIELGSDLKLGRSPGRLVGGPAQLEFYDWEPNLLPPSQKQPTLSIYTAVQTASKQRPTADTDDIPSDRQNDTAGDKYYLFGPGKGVKRKLIPPRQAGAASPQAAANDATATYESCGAIKSDLERSKPGTRAGPAAPGSDCAATIAELAKKGVGPPAGSLVVKVPRGVVVLKDESRPKSTDVTPLGYWILEDDSELSAADITNPKQAFDPQTNEPIIAFDFTAKGRAAFARVTKREAERGQNVPRAPGRPIFDTFQHFAIALDGQLVSLATLDYVGNPQGIPGDTGAQISGAGDIQQTRDLVRSLGYRPLPLDLVLVGVR